jgi:hypothetical protein
MHGAKQHWRRWAICFALAFAFSLQACQSKIAEPEKVCGPVTFETMPAAPRDVSGALIVTDISGSMKGFAQTSSRRLYTVHDALERAVRGTTNEAIQRCELGEAIDCQHPKPLNQMDSPTTYTANESRLDRFLAQTNSDDKDKAAVDMLAQHRISILVSDGMQARNPNGSAESPCLGGADPQCMAYLLKQRAEKGYGIWLTLFYLPFSGEHYSERPLDDALWQKIETHVGSLTADPAFPDVRFSVKRQGSGAGFTHYQFKGVKPMIVLALSRDINAGRRFTTDFSEAIKREGVAQPANAVHNIELAPLSVRERRVTKIELPRDAPIEGVYPIEGKRPKKEEGLFDYLIECDRNAATQLNVSWEEKRGEQILPPGIQAVYNLVAMNRGTLPGQNLTMNPTEKTIEMKLTCGHLDKGKYEACFNLQAELSTDPNSKAFWQTLSSDNMYEAPERLFGLRDLIQEVLKSTLQRPRVTDRVVFHLERK